MGLYCKYDVIFFKLVWLLAATGFHFWLSPKTKQKTQGFTWLLTGLTGHRRCGSNSLQWKERASDGWLNCILPKPTKLAIAQTLVAF